MFFKYLLLAPFFRSAFRSVCVVVVAPVAFVFVRNQKFFLWKLQNQLLWKPFSVLQLLKKFFFSHQQKKERTEQVC